ncbi:hypothetical protein J6590_071743 [Homalodisca vitripennis]|nr:hypothetical protein J6590_071743 [Homalodisca vitripennis]
MKTVERQDNETNQREDCLAGGLLARTGSLSGHLYKPWLISTLLIRLSRANRRTLYTQYGTVGRN